MKTPSIPFTQHLLHTHAACLWNPIFFLKAKCAVSSYPDWIFWVKISSVHLEIILIRSIPPCFSLPSPSTGTGYPVSPWFPRFASLRVVEPALLIVVRQTQHLHVAQVVPFNVDADAVLRGFQQNPSDKHWGYGVSPMGNHGDVRSGDIIYAP